MAEAGKVPSDQEATDDTKLERSEDIFHPIGPNWVLKLMGGLGSIKNQNLRKIIGWRKKGKLIRIKNPVKKSSKNQKKKRNMCKKSVMIRKTKLETKIEAYVRTAKYVLSLSPENADNHKVSKTSKEMANLKGKGKASNKIIQGASSFPRKVKYIAQLIVNFLFLAELTRRLGSLYWPEGGSSSCTSGIQ